MVYRDTIEEIVGNKETEQLIPPVAGARVKMNLKIIFPISCLLQLLGKFVLRQITIEMMDI